MPLLYRKIKYIILMILTTVCISTGATPIHSVPVPKNTLRVPLKTSKETMSGNFISYVKILASRIREPGIPEAEETEISNQELYKRLKEILSRETFNNSTLEKDIETLDLLYLVFEDFFYDKWYLDPLNVELKRDTLVQMIRELFNPLFERQGFCVIDFFAGETGQPTILPKSELKKIGYDTKRQKLYVYGIDNRISREYASAKHSIGVIRGNIFELYIAKSSVDVVTMFHPYSYAKTMYIRGIEIPNVKPIISAANKILRPGGLIYIAPNSGQDYKEDPVLYENALKKLGFININIIYPYPDKFPSSRLYDKPMCLIKARKPLDPVKVTKQILIEL